MTSTRNTKRKSARLPAMLAAAAIAACSSAPRSIVTPDIELSSLSLMGASADAQTFGVTLLVRNPNTVAVPIRQIRFTARLAGEGYLTGQTGEAVTIAPMGTERLRVEIETDRVSSQSRLMAWVQGPESALPYELDGEIDLGGRPPRLRPFARAGRVPFSIRLGD